MPFNSAQRQIEFITIPGMDGDAINSHRRFNNVEITYNCTIKHLHDKFTTIADQINAIVAWLNSNVDDYAKLQDSYNINKYRIAHFDGAVLPNRSGTIAYSITITFNCKPFKYDINGDEYTTKTISTTADTVIDMTNYEAFKGYPIICLTSIDTDADIIALQFDLNGTNWLVAGKGIIYIDSQIGKVYDDNNNLYFYHNGTPDLFVPPTGMPILNSGQNTITVAKQSDSNIQKIAIMPRWYSL